VLRTKTSVRRTGRGQLKAVGKTLVGVGCESSTNKHWAHSCHEFRYYEKLLIEDSTPLLSLSEPLEESEDVTLIPTDAVELIRRAIARLSANKGDPCVLKAAIRPMVKRLDPTFDENTYGVSTFAELLKQHAAIFEVRKGRHDQEYRIKEHSDG
jgi:hypothetical protein